MKKKFLIIVLVLVSMSLNSCSSSEKNISNNDSLETKTESIATKDANKNIQVDTKTTETKKTDSTEISQTSDNSIAGQYMYQAQSEKKYIVLEESNSNITGRYYGTTDDFDQAREGYLPGYFVIEMKNLLIKNDEISFYIELTENDLFDKAIDLNIKSSGEISLTENPRWKQSSGGFNEERDGTIEYTALIKNNTLELKLPSIYSEDPKDAGVFIFEKQN